MKKSTNMKTYASYLGKYTILIPDAEGIGVYITSFWFILLSVWVFAAAFATIIAFLTRIFELCLLMAGVGAIFGWYLVTHYYVGKPKQRIEYKDLSSISVSAPDVNFALKDNTLFLVRILPRRQEKFLSDISLAMYKEKEYTLERRGRLYKLLKLDENGEKIYED